MSWIVWIIIFIVIIAVMRFFETGKGFRTGSQWNYGRKNFIMTRAEHECFNVLIEGLGNEYYIFPQIHLDAIVYPKAGHRNRLYALRHINQKSVDFVICDKAYLRPLLAIELDDSTHDQPDRVARDVIVEAILKNAGIPFYRIKNSSNFDFKKLTEEIKQNKLTP